MAMPVQYLRLGFVIATPQKQPIVNVMWYSASGALIGSPTTAVNTILAAIMGTITDNIASVLTTGTHNLTLEGYLYHDLQAYYGDIVSPTVGAIDEDELPSHDAVVVQKRTAQIGRTGRGRWFLGGIPDAFCDENVLTDSAANAYINVMSDWKTPVTAAGLTCTPAHHSQKDQTLYPITDVVVIRRIYTQRRRMYRPGHA